MTTENVTAYWSNLTAVIVAGLREAEDFDDVWRTVPRGAAMTLAWAAVRRAVTGSPGPWDSVGWLAKASPLDQLRALARAAAIAERLGAQYLNREDVP